jgi:N-methylhydantoinase A
VPLVDIGTIGAGGGSVGWVDSGGLLRVGPHSAGADPGPAAYGLGGTEATITDASCVLGYLGPIDLAGGAVRLRPELADAAVARIGRRLCKPREYVAEGMLQIAIENMAGEIRKNLVQRGEDPREFSLFSFGGAGSMFASVLARELEMREVIIPPHAGVFSAFGMLGADLRHDVHRTFYGKLSEVEPANLARAFGDAERSALEQLDDEDLSLSRELALRYVGQRHELRVPLAGSAITQGSLLDARSSFDRLHALNYGHERPTDSVEVRAISVIAAVSRPKPQLSNRGCLRPGNALTERRRIRLVGDNDAQDVPVYDRTQLATGCELHGPAVLESPDATIVLHGGERATVHETGSVLVEGWR